MPLPKSKNTNYIPTRNEIDQEITENFGQMEDYSNEPDLNDLQELTDEDLVQEDTQNNDYQNNYQDYQEDTQSYQNINDNADYNQKEEIKEESDYEKQLKAAQEKEDKKPKKKMSNKQLMIVSGISLTVLTIIIIIVAILIFNKNKNNPKVDNTTVEDNIENTNDNSNDIENKEEDNTNKEIKKEKKKKKKKNLFSNQDFEITFNYPYIDIKALQDRFDGSLYLIIKNENDYSICYTSSNTFTKDNIKTEELTCNGTQPNKKSKIENIYLINE